MELAVPFESETSSEEVPVRLDQLATQLRDAGMNEQEIGLDTSIEWYVHERPHLGMDHLSATARLVEWAKEQLLTQDLPPGTSRRRRHT